MKEFAWIEKAARLFGRQHPGVPVGIGDDCAVLDGRGLLLASTDTVVAGVHFQREHLTPADIGWRALATALSDLAACGADPSRPIVALVSLQAPPDLTDAELDALAEGFRDCAQAHGCHIVGGDTVSTPGPLALTATVLGYAERPILRRGAAAGDALVVTGALGAAGVALSALAAGRIGPAVASCAAAYRRPRALLETGAALAEKATAMIDISDGLVQDLGHICEASGLGAEIELDLLPITETTRRLAGELGLDAVHIAAGFGDDYQLLACLSPADVMARCAQISGLTVIGRMTTERKVVTLQDGLPVNLPATGYQHGG